MFDQQPLPDLPDHWEVVVVEDVTENISLTDSKLKKDDYAKDGQLPIIDQGEEYIGGYTPDAKLTVDCNPPVVVFGDHTRAFKYVDFDFVAGADGVKVLKPSERYDPKLFYYFAKAIRLPDKGYARHYKYLRKAKIPLPPLPEQRRIVAKIEELFSNLDAGRADLQTAQRQLERYRLSVLQAAVEGRLTAAWRRTHAPEPADALLERILDERRQQWEKDYRAKYEAKGKEPPNGWKSRYTKPEEPETKGLPELPDGWVWTNIENACIVYGGVTKNARKGGDLVEMPYLRVANVYANELRLDEIKQIKVKRSRLYKYLLREGDLLVVEGNGSKSQIGRVARWDGSVEPCVHQNHLIKVRPMIKEMGHYLIWWMLSPNGRRHITKVASSTSGLYTLSMTKVRNIPVPLPPLAEQQQIVAEVERLLSVADDAVQTTEREHTRAERLRQSILKQAFSGQLVPHEGGTASAPAPSPNGTQRPGEQIELEL